MSLAEAECRAENLGQQIAFGCLMAWALAMLAIGAVTSFGAEAAAPNAFSLVAAF
jgi:hypothetical protein